MLKKILARQRDSGRRNGPLMWSIILIYLVSVLSRFPKASDYLSSSGDTIAAIHDESNNFLNSTIYTTQNTQTILRKYHWGDKPNEFKVFSAESLTVHTKTLTFPWLPEKRFASFRRLVLVTGEQKYFTHTQNTYLLNVSSVIGDDHFLFYYHMGSLFRLQSIISPESAALETLTKNKNFSLNFWLRFINTQGESLTSTYELPSYPDNGEPRICHCNEIKETVSSHNFSCGLILKTFQIWFWESPIWIIVYHLIVPVGLTLLVSSICDALLGQHNAH